VNECVATSVLPLKQQKFFKMYDRFIVCEALFHNAKLITKDKEIKESGIEEVIW